MEKQGAFRVVGAGEYLPPIRVRAYLQDPLVAETLKHVGIAEVELAGESVLGDGPTNSRVAVVDYNAELDEVFAPARLRADRTGFIVGNAAERENLQFHQVNVWTVINQTLAQLEGPHIFGRRIPWAFDRGRLLVLPHAGYWENAYYDRETGALHFFYFEGPDGRTVYTCLSRDIVTHELGHAILDGLKPYYNEVSSPSTAGFHEYFGDAIAMTSALFQKEMVVEVAGRLGSLHRNNLIAGIAAEFGRAMSEKAYSDISDNYLRSGNNKLTMADLEGVYEEHDYALVLVGVYYQLLVSVYKQNLKQITGGKKANGGHRVRALIRAAKVTTRMTLRALDYCNPVDISYLDYARAILRADTVAYPVDTPNYRGLATDVFLQRGIAKSIDELAPPSEIENYRLRGLDVDRLGGSETDAYHFVNDNRLVLGVPPDANLKLVSVGRTNKLSALDRRLPQETLVQFVWPESVRISGAQYGEMSGAFVTLWCGGTLVLDREGNLLHFALKTNTLERRKTLRGYLEYLIREGEFTMDDGEEGLGARGRGGPAVVGSMDGGVLRMSRSAALRHVARKGDRS